MRAEITPKNILMIGPTGVGKTEIARRLARLANAPFVKVEATKFTEVGYVGREVDSIVKDLVDIAVKMTREQEMDKVRHRAMDAAEERILDVLLPRPRTWLSARPSRRAARAAIPVSASARCCARGSSTIARSRSRCARCRSGVEIMAPPGMEELSQQLQGMFSNLGGNRTKPRRLTVREAFKLLTEEEAAELVNEEELKVQALRNAEQNGIVFIDEIDKIARRQETARRGRVARRRAARPAAAGRGLHGQHQVRHGQDRSHAVHRVGRLPHGEAVGPDPGAAGTAADPGRARLRSRSRTSSASSPSRTPRSARSTRRCWRPKV